MKKTIFGCALMLCGGICGTIFGAVVTSNYSSFLSVLPLIGSGRAVGNALVLFYGIAIFGLVIAAISAFSDEEKDKKEDE